MGSKVLDRGAREPGARVLVLTAHEDVMHAKRVLKAGALGYLMKASALEQIPTAIRRVLAGNIYVSDTLGARMLQQQVRGQTDINESPVKTLSDRELEVFEQIGQGCTTREVAAKLNLDVKTVETYRSRIKEKLGLSNATELQ